MKKSGGAISVNCAYACDQCLQDYTTKNITKRSGDVPKKATFLNARVGKRNRRAKFISERAKLQPQNYKKALAKRRLVKLHSKKAVVVKKQARSRNAVLPLRRSARQAAKYMAVQSESNKEPKKGKQKKSKKGAPKRKKGEEASYQKKRTQAFYCYWVNGLHLSRGADAKRVTNFRKKGIFSPDDSTAARREKVKCSLCGEGSRTSKSSYIACEICRGKGLALQICSRVFPIS